MAHLIVGLFTDSKLAGDAVAELKSKGYTKDISLISKNPQESHIDSHSIKQNGTEGAITGATVGAIAGSATTVLAGITAVVIPGIGLVAGTIATALAAATTGAVAGGLVGYLVDKGIPDNTAKKYQNRIQEGDILVATEIDHENEIDAETVMAAHGASDIEHSHK